MASNKLTSNAPSLDPVNEESHVRKATVNDLGSGEHFAVYTRALERFDFDLVRRYLAASPGSKVFKAGLIELMAVSVHRIAAYIYKLDLDVGSHKALLKADNDAPTFFLHSQYKDIDQYPDGVADAVGYWAEAQIFGGVILFDRRQQDGPSANLLDPEEWEDFEFFLSQYRALQQHFQDPYDIYFHSNNRNVTYRIWQLLPKQRKDLFEFLLSETGEVKSSLPILPSEKNLFRVDPEDPVTETRIYRDIWERKPLGDDDGDARRHHCRGDRVEYPCRTDEERSKGRGFFRNELIWEIKSLEDRAQELATARAQGTQSASPPTEE
ncbi:hypothetical protein J7T55_005300 [Diaporthe amygdali]|uniref:uncharacterized protein n=1 Tax=Phomopsis amygdali TaxID=1214568 RepID=UPI0022FEACD7|nr:uncharacterized protein J7T55_005300 [Diaporthe amygdali]KAJ0108323.1 hypothetical protein J7T55_005300 [Diaporthe amygdali]